MGGSSSRHTSLESEHAEGIVLVKGIRLTDRVVDRMKGTPPVQDPQFKSSTYAPVSQPETPPNETPTPTEPETPQNETPISHASALVPPPPLQESINPLVSKSAPASMPSVQKHVVATTSTNSVGPAPPAEPSLLTVTEPVAMPLPAEIVPVVLPSSADAVEATVTSPKIKAKPIKSTTMPLTNDVLTAPPVKAVSLLSTDKTIDIHEVESSYLSTPTLTSDTSITVEQEKLPITPTHKPVAKIELPLLFDTTFPTSIEKMEISKDMQTSSVKPNDLRSSPLSCAVPLPCEDFSVRQVVCPPTKDTPPTRPVVEPTNSPVLASLTETLGPLTFPQNVVKEEHLRKLIREELQKHLQDEKKMAELKLHQQFEEKKAKAEESAQAEVQQQLQAEVEKMSKQVQLALQQTLKDVILQKSKKIHNEQLLCQYYWMKKNKQIQKLEKKERDLVKQDLMYKEQLAKLEEKTAKISRVTSESFRKGLEETHKRFKRYQIKPVCSDLQREILKCYLQNSGKSLTCSSIALQYVKCVHNVKQNKKLSTGQ